MELVDAATHLASGGVGVVSMGAVARFIIVRYFKERDEADEDVKKALKENAEKNTAVAVELAKIGVQLTSLQRAADATTNYGEAIAVLQSQVTDVKQDVNNIGCKVRGLSNGLSER